MTDARQLATLEKALSDSLPTLWIDAPAVAASDADMVNTSKTTKWVNIVGGTFTAVKIGPAGSGTAVGGLTASTALPVLLPVRSGHALRITYTVAPTIQWFES